MRRQRTFGSCVAVVGVLIAASVAGSSLAADASSDIASWPEDSRLAARAMIERFGEPQKKDDQSLTWYGLFRGRRTVVHRSAPNDAIIEQVVLYRVPAKTADRLRSFDSRIRIDRDAGEMSARADAIRTDFLLLNLAHEIASGFKTVNEAREFFHRQTQLAETGKSSRYREVLIFEEPLRSRPVPFVLPAGVNPPPRYETER